jgi:hypothetical protein
MLYRIAFDGANDAEHDEGADDGAKGEHEAGKLETFERLRSREMLLRRPSRRRTARRLTMDVSDPHSKGKKRMEMTQRTENSHMQETSIPCQPLSQRNTLIYSRNIPQILVITSISSTRRMTNPEMKTCPNDSKFLSLQIEKRMVGIS